MVFVHKKIFEIMRKTSGFVKICRRKFSRKKPAFKEGALSGCPARAQKKRSFPAPLFAKVQLAALRPLSADGEEQGRRAEERRNRCGFGNLFEGHREGFVVPREFRQGVHEIDRHKIGIGVAEIEVGERSRGDEIESVADVVGAVKAVEIYFNLSVADLRKFSRDGNLVVVFKGIHVEEQPAGIPLCGVYNRCAVGNSEISAVEIERSRGCFGRGEDKFAAVEG